MRGRLWIAGCLLLTVFGFIVGLGFGRESDDVRDGFAAAAAAPPGGGGVAAASPPASTLQGLGPEERRDIEVFRAASQSVVFITSIALRRDLWSLDVEQIPQGSGSGFLWDRRGHVVTNFHVIASGDRFSVTLADQSEWDAEVVGAAPEKDLAVLKIGAPLDRLAPLTQGVSHDLLVGQKVLALGNPFGLDHSMTAGIVSALGREIRSPSDRLIRDVIQTDAAINPGNSGGPLLDSSGRLIGINTMIYSPSGASAGIGFAVPVDTVKRLVPQLIDKGRAVNPGIGIVPLNDAMAARFDVLGVAVANVVTGSPADRAGIEGIVRTRRGYKFGDVIVAVGDKPIRSTDDLAYAFETAGVGREVTLTVRRDGKDRKVEVTLTDVK